MMWSKFAGRVPKDRRLVSKQGGEQRWWVVVNGQWRRDAVLTNVRVPQYPNKTRIQSVRKRVVLNPVQKLLLQYLHNG